MGVVASLNDGVEGWLERCSSYKETIDIWLLNEVFRVLLADRAAIDDPDLLGGSL